MENKRFSKPIKKDNIAVAEITGVMKIADNTHRFCSEAYYITILNLRLHQDMYDLSLKVENDGSFVEYNWASGKNGYRVLSLKDLLGIDFGLIKEFAKSLDFYFTYTILLSPENVYLFFCPREKSTQFKRKPPNFHPSMVCLHKSVFKNPT